MKNTSQCPTDTTNYPCYTSIQEALSAAVAGDSVLVEPGIYTEKITLRTDITVSISGRETARTILDGGGSGPVITATSITSTSILNFTIRNATVGIALSNTTSVTIVNNVFYSNTTAVQIQDTVTSQAVTIRNNTFYNNQTAISTNAVPTTTANNIFDNNTTAINSSDSSTTTTNIQYNCFFGNGTGGVFGNTVTNVTTDPNFVDRDDTDLSKRAYHLQQNSPCINAGNPDASVNDIIDTTRNDMGAYGGPSADSIPFIISGLVPGAVTDDGGTPLHYIVPLSWSANLSYLVTHDAAPPGPGGYKIYYNVNKAGPPYDGIGITEGDIVIDVGNVVSTTLNGLSAASAPTEAPTLTLPGFENQTLKLSWSIVTGAAGYIIYYTDLDAVLPQPTTEQSVVVIGGNTTSYELHNLYNYHDYTVQVAAYNQNTYHFAVTAYDSTEDTQAPGVTHESSYSTPELTINIGDPMLGPRSTPPQTQFPEPVTPNPNLPNKGCFIATAAYGYYSAPQVRALREFRDRYLTTSAPGRAFVRWYYQYGPVGAKLINEHPWLKPVVRTALMPAVGGAMFMTRTSIITKTIVFMFIGSLAIARFRKIFTSSANGATTKKGHTS